MIKDEMLEKSFDALNFHDCRIYAIGFEKNKLLFDIDFIEEWDLEQNEYNFKIYPATLVFENVWDIDINIEMDTDLIIDNIERNNPQIPRNIKYLLPYSKEYDWNIDLMVGEIRFKSIGLRIFQRKKIEISKNQNLTMQDRNGISLEEKGIQIVCL